MSRAGEAGLSREDARRLARVLAALSMTNARLVPAGDDGRFEVRVGEERAPRAVVTQAVAATLRALDLVAAETPAGTMAISTAGRGWLARYSADDAGDAYRAQHLARRRVPADDREAPDSPAVTVVDNESPLGWLRSRRDSDGRPMLSSACYAAGERLRADFTRAGMSPRVTADWTAVPSRRGRRGGGGPHAEVLDQAMAARRRLARALDACGADMGSLLLDVCCFLKGLEEAERARGWPRRSGKVVLQIALGRLADHYGISGAAKGPPSDGRIRHWGGEGYRPAVGAGETR